MHEPDRSLGHKVHAHIWPHHDDLVLQGRLLVVLILLSLGLFAVLFALDR